MEITEIATFLVESTEGMFYFGIKAWIFVEVFRGVVDIIVAKLK